MNADQAIALYKSGRVPEGVMFVQLVCDRAMKDDCRGGTKTVWNGKGDIQGYPASLWGKLAPHPDVWAVFDPEVAGEGDDDQAAAERAKAEAARQAEEQRQREAEAKGQGEDLVVASAVPTFEQLHAMGADESRHAELRELAKTANLGLHPRQRIDTVVERLVEHFNLTPAAAEGDEEPQE